MGSDGPAPARRFGELATARGWLALADVDAALAAQGELTRLGLPERIGEILRKRGVLTNDQVREILLEQGAGPLRNLVPGYEIVERLGQGGMGAVYRAHRRADGAAVALKLLPPRLGGNPEFVARFIREARAVAALRHPNIVAGLDAGCADDHYFVAMELVEGESLDARLRREGAIPEAEVVAIGLAVARALAYAHGQGLVHRDVKPGNILLGRTPDTVKLCDLGLAKWVAEDGTAVTQTGLAVGTPQYVAPEQALGERDVDIRADLYSLGATLYHAAAGRAPFTGGSGADVALRRLVADPTPARQANPALSPGLATLIDRLLARQPADRPGSPADVVAALEALEGGAGTGATLPGRPGARSATAGLAVATMVVSALAVGSLAVAWGWSAGGTAAPPPAASGQPVPPDRAAARAEIEALRAEIDALSADQRALDRSLQGLAAAGGSDAIPPEQLAVLRSFATQIERLRQRLDDLARAAGASDPALADRLLRDLDRPAGD